MGNRIERMEGGPTRAELAAGVQPEERPLTILQFRAVVCIFGVLMTVGGLVALVITNTLLYSIRSWLPCAVILTCGVVLLFAGVCCCVVAIKRGEPPIPRKYRIQRAIAMRHQERANQQLSMHQMQSEQYQPQFPSQYATPFTTTDSRYPFGGVPGQGYSPGGGIDEPPPYWAATGQTQHQNQAFSYS